MGWRDLHSLSLDNLDAELQRMCRNAKDIVDKLFMVRYVVTKYLLFYFGVLYFFSEICTEFIRPEEDIRRRLSTGTYRWHVSMRGDQRKRRMEGKELGKDSILGGGGEPRSLNFSAHGNKNLLAGIDLFFFTLC